MNALNYIEQGKPDANEDSNDAQRSRPVKRRRVGADKAIAIQAPRSVYNIQGSRPVTRSQVIADKVVVNP